MAEKDLVISGATAKIDAQIEKIEKELKPGAYQYKTNCRFVYFENETNGGINLKVLNTGNLLKVLAYIKEKNESYCQAVGLINAKIGDCALDEFTWCGYPFEDWLDDITYLIQKLVYNEKVNELKKYKQTLEPLYSQDKKDEILINDILGKLNF